MMEQRTQQLSEVVRGAMLSTDFQQCLSWDFAQGLVLLFCLCWLFWKMSRETGSSSKHGISGSLQEEEEPLDTDRFLYKYPSSRQIPIVVKELVDNLLCVCQMLSGNGFVPRLQSAIEDSTFLEGDDAHLVYRLFVPLEPPPGHSFHLELGTKRDMPVRNSCLRVELECMCTQEYEMQGMLCFLHQPEDLLMNRQEASLLETFCTGSYLDVRKTAFWLQQLMMIAGVVVPGLDKWRLTVLPSSRFCKIKLTNVLERPLTIELVLAVQRGNSDAFVSLE